jgi:hypothetical protein
MNQALERVESLKAALTGAVTATLVGLIIGLVTVSSDAWSNEEATDFGTWLRYLASWSMLFHLSSVGFSGFLFGVTYRYIVRQDRNVQLKLGAVLAFSLVRSLAQLETALPSSYWLIGWSALESLLIFGIAALILDQLMLRGWIKPFDAA